MTAPPSASAPFVLRSPMGLIVGTPVPQAHEPLPQLHPQEAEFTRTFARRRMATFCTGRSVLRQALLALGVPHHEPILRTHRGAPVLPAGIVGSLSHKDEVAVALVDFGDAARTVGVDVELYDDGREHTDIASHVLLPSELSRLAGLDPIARRQAVLQAFSMKEAFYKAIDPRVQRFVGFLEVELQWHDPQRCSFITDAFGAVGAPRSAVGLVQPFSGGTLTCVDIRWGE